MKHFTFTIVGDFEADTEEEAFEEWTDLLTQRRYVHDGTVVEVEDGEAT